MSIDIMAVTVKKYLHVENIMRSLQYLRLLRLLKRMQRDTKHRELSQNCLYLCALSNEREK